MPESKFAPTSETPTTEHLKAAVKEIVKSGVFDLPFYSASSGKEFDSQENAIQHYLEAGAASGLDPHPLFSTNYYGGQNPDVHEAGTNLLIHFINTGGKEGRAPSKYFDSAYYLKTYQDIAASSLNPLVHYLAHGASEGRNPSSHFDTNYYRKNLPANDQASVNPLIHYVLYGEKENRKTNDRREFPREVYLKMREIEPLLPSFDVLAKLPEVKQPKPSRAGKAYLAIQKTIKKGFSHLIIVGELNKTDARNQVSQLIKRVCEELGAAAPLVVLTGEIAESNALELPAQVQVVAPRHLVEKLTQDEELAVLTRLAIQARPEFIHVIESEPGWRMLEQFNRQLKMHSKLVASIFSFSADSDGVRSGFPFHLNACIEHLHCLFLHGPDIGKEIEDQFALSYAPGQRLVPWTPIESGATALKDTGYLEQPPIKSS